MASDIDDTLETLLRNVERVVDSAAVSVCREFYPTHTAETFISGRLVDRIEQALRGSKLVSRDLRLDVSAGDFTPARERKSGADLYVSMDRFDQEKPTTKGALIQIKWDDALTDGAEWNRLRNQSRRMLHRSEDSYVWVLKPSGISCVSAMRTKNEGRPNSLYRNEISPGQLIADGLRCNRGDIQIGRDAELPTRAGIDTMMDRLSARRFLNLDIRRRPGSALVIARRRSP